MSDREFEGRLLQFLDTLRAEREGEPARGLRRFAGTVRGAAGLAVGVLTARRKREEGLGETDLRALEGLVARLGTLKGVPMKMGQILSYLEADLPEEMRRLLALLQTQSPQTPFPEVEAVVREDLGAQAEGLLAGLERQAVSAASIGQVYRGRLPDGAAVAVKVRHPGIEEAIRADFKGAAAGTAFARLMAPGAGATARDFVAEAQARLLEECDYLLEAEQQRTFGRLFADHPDLVVPRVFDGWCARRVLTTSWEEGRDFGAFCEGASQAERDRAGRALFELYIGTLYRHGLFHADPHPGNYRLRADGLVVVFDYGCVRRFDAASVAAFVTLADAVRSGDEWRMREGLAAMGGEPPLDARAFAHLRGLLEAFFAPLRAAGPRRVDGRVAFDARQAMRDKLAIGRLRLPGKFLFLFRIRFGLYSVLARLGAVNDWAALEQGYAADARRQRAGG